MGFTRETMHFLRNTDIPTNSSMCCLSRAKREVLTRLTNSPTLPKVFIDGQFYGDTDILDPMETRARSSPVEKAFAAS